MQTVVQEDALVQFLLSEFESGSTRNSEEVSGIPRQDVERSFRRLHIVQLTNDESSILVASCCAEEDACDGNYVQRQTLVREAYQSMSVLFLVRYIGRRLSVLYSNAEGESMLYIPTFPLKKLAERLLHVVRLVGSSGNNKGSEITIKFPDPAEYMAMDQNEQQTDANSLACKNNVTMRAIDAKTSIRVTGHSRMTEMPVTLSFSIENSVRRSNASAILTLVSDLGHELKVPASITFGIPSNLCADEEEAEKYLCSIAGSFVLHCEQDTFTYLQLPPPTTTLL